MKLTQKEYRMMETLTHNEQEMTVEGYAVVFDSPTVLYEHNGKQYKEVIKRGAFDGCDMDDVVFNYNHDDGTLLGRTKNKTLELMVDDKGLLVRGKIANTAIGKDVYELIKRGDINKMSFAFEVSEDFYDTYGLTREVRKIKKLYDVSAVIRPAYDSTSIVQRKFQEYETQKENLISKIEKLLGGK